MPFMDRTPTFKIAFSRRCCDFIVHFKEVEQEEADRMDSEIATVCGFAKSLAEFRESGDRKKD